MSTKKARRVTAVLVVVVVCLLGGAAWWMINNSSDARDGADEPVPGVTRIGSLIFADCYGVPRDSRGEINTANGVYVIVCDNEHDGQIIEQVDLESLPWAGEDAMRASAQNQCSAAFNRYRAALVEPDTLIPGYFLPSQQQWATGNRVITCTITMQEPFEDTRM